MCKGWRVFDRDPAESFSELFLSHAHKQSRNAGVCSAGGSRFDGLAEVMYWLMFLAVESLLRPICKEIWGKTFFL